MHKNEVKIFENEELGLNVRTILNEDGSISVNAEDTAISFGWSRKEVKNGKSYTSVMWSRMNGFCKELGFAHECAKDDYIPESLYYLLGMKANNERARSYQKWLAIDVLPALRQTGTYKIPTKDKPSNEEKLRIMEMNARSRMAQTYLKLAQVDTLSNTYKSVLVSKAGEVLAGEQILPLPKSERRVYSAKQIGEMFGISANKVGRIANSHNLKSEEYGEYRRDKSKHSAHECDTWVYFDTAIPVFKEILGAEKAVN